MSRIVALVEAVDRREQYIQRILDILHIAFSQWFQYSSRASIENDRCIERCACITYSIAPRRRRPNPIFSPGFCAFSSFQSHAQENLPGRGRFFDFDEASNMSNYIIQDNKKKAKKVPEPGSGWLCCAKRI
jgi:hypothetical protein